MNPDRGVDLSAEGGSIGDPSVTSGEATVASVNHIPGGFVTSEEEGFFETIRVREEASLGGWLWSGDLFTVEHERGGGVQGGWGGGWADWFEGHLAPLFVMLFTVTPRRRASRRSCRWFRRAKEPKIGEPNGRAGPERAAAAVALLPTKAAMAVNRNGFFIVSILS
jgi:hypothetical protein